MYAKTDDPTSNLTDKDTVGGKALEPLNAYDDSGPTLPKSFFVRIRGWDNGDEEEARTFGQGVSEWARAYSRVRDLSRLESVIIAWDYPEALASLDTGEGMPVAARTENEYGEGGILAPSRGAGFMLLDTIGSVFNRSTTA